VTSAALRKVSPLGVPRRFCLPALTWLAGQTPAPVNEADTVLLPDGLSALKRVARLTDLKIDGAYLNLDGGFDSRHNRKAIESIQSCGVHYAASATASLPFTG
jgi:hypothetical protein